jgi:hypothetical protein
MKKNKIRWLLEGRYFLESDEKTGNDVKWNFFEVDALIAI